MTAEAKDVLNAARAMYAAQGGWSSSALESMAKKILADLKDAKETVVLKRV